jgi:hypothetical protein
VAFPAEKALIAIPAEGHEALLGLLDSEDAARSLMTVHMLDVLQSPITDLPICGCRTHGEISCSTALSTFLNITGSVWPVISPEHQQ